MLSTSKRFLVRQKELGLSECERLCRRPSREIEELASHVGASRAPGGAARIPLGTALNMLVFSIATDHSVERHVMTPWLPGLRDEALLELGADVSNWAFDGTHEEGLQFWPILYGDGDAVRPRITGLLGCYSGSPTREIRFFSSGDIERIAATSYGQDNSIRSPRFTVNAHDLAARVKAICGTPLFTAQTADAL